MKFVKAFIILVVGVAVGAPVAVIWATILARRTTVLTRHPATVIPVQQETHHAQAQAPAAPQRRKSRRFR